MGSCYAKNIEKSPFFKNKLALTQKTPVLTYQTQYIKMFLGIWATYFVTTTLAENPRNRVKNANLCQKPGQKIDACSKLEYNYLLKRKLAIDVYIKVVVWKLLYEWSISKKINL